MQNNWSLRFHSNLSPKFCLKLRACVDSESTLPLNIELSELAVRLTNHVGVFLQSQLFGHQRGAYPVLVLQFVGPFNLKIRQLQKYLSQRVTLLM